MHVSMGSGLGVGSVTPPVYLRMKIKTCTKLSTSLRYLPSVQNLNHSHRQSVTKSRPNFWKRWQCHFLEDASAVWDFRSPTRTVTVCCVGFFNWVHSFQGNVVSFIYFCSPWHTSGEAVKGGSFDSVFVNLNWVVIPWDVGTISRTPFVLSLTN